jgi:hypothetical protein
MRYRTRGRTGIKASSRGLPPGRDERTSRSRTMEQLDDLLAGMDVTLSDDLLDRIDEIVPPGTNLNATDAGWQNPALAPAARRRSA